MDESTLFRAFFQKRLKMLKHRLTSQEVKLLLAKLQAIPEDEQTGIALQEALSAVTGLDPARVATAFQDVKKEQVEVVFWLTTHLPIQDKRVPSPRPILKRSGPGELFRDLGKIAPASPQVGTLSRDLGDLDNTMDRIKDLLKKR